MTDFGVYYDRPTGAAGERIGPARECRPNPVVARPRRRVYIAGPIVNGDLAGNIDRATDALFALMAAGLAPFCPHLSCFSGPLLRTWQGKPYALAEVMPRGVAVEQWYETDLAWVGAADAVLRLPGEGKGSDGEVAEARRRGIPVFYSVAEVVAWAKG